VRLKPFLSIFVTVLVAVAVFAAAAVAATASKSSRPAAGERSSTVVHRTKRKHVESRHREASRPHHVRAPRKPHKAHKAPATKTQKKAKPKAPSVPPVKTIKPKRPVTPPKTIKPKPPVSPPSKPAPPTTTPPPTSTPPTSTPPTSTPPTSTPPTSTPPSGGQSGNPTTEMGAACMTSSDTGPVPTGSWSNDFSTGNFCQWTWWGQGQQNIWGNTSVVTASSAGIPQLDQGGANVAQMTVTAADANAGSINAKLYEGFGHFDAQGNEHSPTNVSGTYSAWYYIPSSYKVAPNTWSNIFQFKEEYREPGGGQQSDPSWWIQLAPESWAKTYYGATWVGPQPTDPEAPVAVLNRWCNDWNRQVVLEAVPLNHWFNISALLTQGQSLQFSIAGKPFDTALASQYPVSPFHGSDSEEWIFGVGNYSTAPDTTLYVGAASYTPSS
jgi:hypothetical protein